MNADEIFIVTDAAPGGDARNTIVRGAISHEAALDVIQGVFPGRTPMSVVSLAEMEASTQRIREAVKNGSDPDFEILG